MSIPAIPSNPAGPGRRFPVVRIALLVVVAAAGAALIARQDTVSPSLSFTNVALGSGVAAAQTRSLPTFAAIDLTGAGAVDVRTGARQSVVVHADDNLIDRVTTSVRDGVLVVSERGSVDPRVPLRIEVTAPDLHSARLRGSGTITVDGVATHTFTAEVPGSGLLTVSGTTDQLSANLSGSGIMQLGDLSARSVTATVAGSGRLEVHATHTLVASVPGNGVIVYSGNPTSLEQVVAGSGTIQPR